MWGKNRWRKKIAMTIGWYEHDYIMTANYTWKKKITVYVKCWMKKFSSVVS